MLLAQRAAEELERFRAEFLQGAQARGVPLEVAAEVFEQLRAFGGDRFAKSHAAAFAVRVCWSAWLQRYHPAAFYAGLLNNQPMDFWSPAVLIHGTGRHGVRVLPVNVNASGARYEAREGALRIGLASVRGLAVARRGGGVARVAPAGRR